MYVKDSILMRMVMGVKVSIKAYLAACCQRQLVSVECTIKGSGEE
jgi:hypothetical protein